VKTAAGSDLSLVSDAYHEDKVFAVMAMMTNHMKIRHYFGFTLLYEKKCVHSLQSSYS
jgi:hypothetical protein